MVLGTSGNQSLAKSSPRLRFLSVAPAWSLEEFAGWLERGAEAVADDPRGDSWTSAFPTLLLSEDDFPADQIISQLNQLARKSQAAYGTASAAILRVLNNIGAGRSPEYVRFLITLAGSVRPAGYIEAVRRHLDRPSIQSQAPDWQVIADILVDRAFSESTKPNGLRLISSFRNTPWWRTDYYGKTVILRIEINPAEWPDIRQAEENLLFELEDTDPDGYKAINDAVENNLPEDDAGPTQRRRLTTTDTIARAAEQTKKAIYTVYDNIIRLQNKA